MTASDIFVAVWAAVACFLILLPFAVIAVMAWRAPWGREDAQGFRRIKK